MNLLVFGGTQFVGRHLVETLLRRGHALTLFHRGITNSGLFPRATHIHGDRRQPYSEAITGQSWDAVIDVNGYIPSELRRSCDALVSRTGRYHFVSTISVYDTESGLELNETSPMLPAIDHTEEVTAETYGGLKVACEREVRDAFGERATLFRPGLLIGPYDHTYRFPYWVQRFVDGGPVAVPDKLDCPLQQLDARDLAEFTADLVERDQPGTFNTAGETATFGAFLAPLRARFLAVEVATVPEARLQEHGIDPMRAFPLLFRLSAARGILADSSRALAEGLRRRPIAESVTDVADWVQSNGAPVRENGALSAAQTARLLG
jgi:2'-hydroxyisoflavone reductase